MTLRQEINGLRIVADNYKLKIDSLKKELAEQSALLEKLYDSVGTIRHLLNRMAKYSQDNAENLDLTEMSDCVDVALAAYESYKTLKQQKP